jgi:hypothetical protein
MIQGPHLIIAYQGPPNKSENQNIVNELYSTLVGNIFLNVVLPWIRNLWMSFLSYYPHSKEVAGVKEVKINRSSRGSKTVQIYSINAK